MTSLRDPQHIVRDALRQLASGAVLACKSASRTTKEEWMTAKVPTLLETLERSLSPDQYRLFKEDIWKFFLEAFEKYFDDFAVFRSNTIEPLKMPDTADVCGMLAAFEEWATIASQGAPQNVKLTAAMCEIIATRESKKGPLPSQMNSTIGVLSEWKLTFVPDLVIRFVALAIVKYTDGVCRGCIFNAMRELASITEINGFDIVAPSLRGFTPMIAPCPASPSSKANEFIEHSRTSKEFVFALASKLGVRTVGQHDLPPIDEIKKLCRVLPRGSIALDPAVIASLQDGEDRHTCVGGDAAAPTNSAAHAAGGGGDDGAATAAAATVPHAAGGSDGGRRSAATPTVAQTADGLGGAGGAGSVTADAGMYDAVVVTPGAAALDVAMSDTLDGMLSVTGKGHSVSSESLNLLQKVVGDYGRFTESCFGRLQQMQERHAASTERILQMTVAANSATAEKCGQMVTSVVAASQEMVQTMVDMNERNERARAEERKAAEAERDRIQTAAAEERKAAAEERAKDRDAEEKSRTAFLGALTEQNAAATANFAMVVELLKDRPRQLVPPMPRSAGAGGSSPPQSVIVPQATTACPSTSLGPAPPNASAIEAAVAAADGAGRASSPQSNQVQQATTTTPSTVLGPPQTSAIAAAVAVATPAAPATEEKVDATLSLPACAGGGGTSVEELKRERDNLLAQLAAAEKAKASGKGKRKAQEGDDAAAAAADEPKRTVRAREGDI